VTGRSDYSKFKKHLKKYNVKTDENTIKQLKTWP